MHQRFILFTDPTALRGTAIVSRLLINRLFKTRTRPTNLPIPDSKIFRVQLQPARDAYCVDVGSGLQSMKLP